jgi:hypothetical protein
MELVIPIVILAVVVGAGLFAMRGLAKSSRGPGAQQDGQLPKQPLEEEGPLGGTPQGHGTLSEHDVPKDSPAREAVEHAAPRGDQ